MIQSEPTRLAEIVRSIAILLGMAGIAVTEDVEQAAVAVIGGALILVSWAIAEWQRRRVYAPDTVQRIANAATELPAGTPVDIVTYAKVLNDGPSDG